jgi:hypothetical protein
MALQEISPAVSQIAQLGIETTPGTPVAATKRLPNFKVDMSPDGSFGEYRSSGSIFIEQVFPGEELSHGTSSGGMSYTDILYPASAWISYAAPSGDATNGYLWGLAPNPLGGDTYKTYTLEQGDSKNGYEFAHTVWSGFGMKFSKKEATHSGELLGRAIKIEALTTGGITTVEKQPIIPGKVEMYYASTMAALTRVDTVTLGSPSAGTFTLTYAGQTTSGIAYNAAASAVQTALEGLSTVGAGKATVTGANGGPYTVQWNIPDALALTGNGGGLTGGSFAITTASPVKVGRLFDTEFKLSNRYVPVFQMDADDNSFVTIVLGEPEVSLMVKLGARTDPALNEFGDPFTLGDMRDAVTNYVRIQSKGQAIGALGYKHFFALDMAVQVNKPLKLEDQNSVRGIGWEFRVVNDPTAGYPFKLWARNKLSGL